MSCFGGNGFCWRSVFWGTRTELEATAILGWLVANSRDLGGGGNRRRQTVVSVSALQNPIELGRFGVP